MIVKRAAEPHNTTRHRLCFTKNLIMRNLFKTIARWYFTAASEIYRKDF